MRRNFLVLALALLVGGFTAEAVADDSGKKTKTPSSLFQFR